MVAPAVDGIDLFKIAGRSISGWIPSLKAGTDSPIRQPFCSQLEERLLLYLEYTIPRSPATPVATLVLRSRPPTDCLPRRMPLLPSGTRLRANPTSICPMWWAP